MACVSRQARLMMSLTKSHVENSVPVCETASAAVESQSTQSTTVVGAA